MVVDRVFCRVEERDVVFAQCAQNGLDTHLAQDEVQWEMRTDTAFHYNVKAVLLALDEMCADFGLDFDPAQLPQQSVGKSDQVDGLYSEAGTRIREAAGSL